MGDEVPRTLRDPRAEPHCPDCGQRRELTATRHKVLGAWVPEWKVQPCHNPECGLYEGGHGAEAATSHAEAATPRPEASAAEAAGPHTEAATTHVTGKNGENGRSPATG
ncbi:hypothetical protein [Streptomyces sp. NPDC003327]